MGQLVRTDANVVTALTTTGFYIQDRLGVTDPAGVVRVASFCLVSMAVVITVMQGFVFQVMHLRPQLLLRLCGPSFVTALLVMSQAHSMPTLIALASI